MQKKMRQFLAAFSKLTLLAITAGHLMASTADAQQTRSNNVGYTPPGAAAGSPGGSQQLNLHESVNPFSGKLNFNFAFMLVRNRGRAEVSLNMPIQRHW